MFYLYFKSSRINSPVTCVTLCGRIIDTERFQVVLLITLYHVIILILILIYNANVILLANKIEKRKGHSDGGRDRQGQKSKDRNEAKKERNVSRDTIGCLEANDIAPSRWETLRGEMLYNPPSIPAASGTDTGEADKKITRANTLPWR